MKKKLSWLLVLLLTLSLFGTAMAEVNKEGLPIVDETATFSILVDDSGKLEDKVMYPILEEQTNVKVDAILLPYEVARERKNILISSGDYPDAIGGWLLSETDILNDGMGEGLYIPLEDLIEEYAPNMRAILEIPGVRQTMTLPDGHIYTIPYVIEEPLVTFLPWINMDWLERVGMEMPTTTDELTEVLRAFKEQDANGNGDPNDEIPFSGDPNNLNIGQLAGWFGVNAYGSSRGTHPYFAMIDGKIEFQANKEGFRDFIKYFAGLYAEGLVDPELFTQDLALWKSKGKQDLYGVSVAYGSGDFYDPDPITNKTPFDALPVLRASDDIEPVYRRNGYGVTTFRTQVAITDKAADPALIIRWFDNVFELDNSIQIQNGLFGVKIEKLDDGSFRRLDESGLTEEEREKYDWGNMFTQSLPKLIPVGLKIAPAEGIEPKYEEKPIADALYEPYLDEPIPQAWLTGEAAERSSALQTDIASYVDQKVAEWISGEKDIDAEWDAYVAQLDKLGLAELTQIKQDAIDSIPAE